METFSLKNNQHYYNFLKATTERSKELFSYIDKAIEPEMFIVLVRPIEQSKTNIEVLWLKGFCEYNDVDVSNFEKSLPRYLEKNLNNSENTNNLFRISKKALRHALVKYENELNLTDPKFKGKRIYYSEANDVNGTMLFLGLVIDKNILEKYPSIDLSEEFSKDVFLSVSYIDSLINEFLDKLRIELDLPDSINGFHVGFDAIVRQAGRNFASDILYRISGKRQAHWNEHIFSICSAISRTHYEHEEAIGSILLAPTNFIKNSIEFSASVQIRQIRSMRKLLELTKDKTMTLHCDGEKVLGLCKRPKRFPKGSPCFLFEFLGRHRWQISYANKVVLVVSYGVPLPPKMSFEEKEFVDAIKGVFKIKSERKIEKLLTLTQAAAKEQRGTILVISKNAKEEASRLAAQSTPIVQTLLTPEILHSLTPIDGAILMNHNGMCFSIGTILDGPVSQNGDSARGARYNSAVKYIEFRRAQGDVCMAIVISEDGSIDIIPKIEEASPAKKAKAEGNH